MAAKKKERIDKKSFIEGNCYYFLLTNGDEGIGIFETMASVGDLELREYLEISNEYYDNNAGWMFFWADIQIAREATSSEKAWLDACIEADEYVEGSKEPAINNDYSLF